MRTATIRSRDLELSLVREIAVTTDDRRSETAAQTGGEPMIDFAGKRTGAAVMTTSSRALVYGIVMLVTSVAAAPTVVHA